MFNARELNKLVSAPKKKAATKPAPVKTAAAHKSQAKYAAAVKPVLTDEDGDYVPVGVGGLLAATEKLLAVNRGLEDSDERDSYGYKRIWSVDRHLRERIKLDAGRVRQNLMRNVSRMRSLRGAHPFVFDGYSQGMLLGDPGAGNPLSSPLEEINPMHILEQARRITQMGPGGIGSSEAITEAAQSVHPSQFGFVSAVEGPECHSEDTEVFTRKGWKYWKDVTYADELACLIDGRMEFYIAEHLHKSYYSGEMIGVESKCMSFLVTPNHRMRFRKYGSKDESVHIELAADVFDRSVKFLTCHNPFVGQYQPMFELPAVEAGSNSQIQFPPMLMEDWTELLGWYLGEGTMWVPKSGELARSCARVTQSQSANPEKVNRLAVLLGRLPFAWSYQSGLTFHVCGKQLLQYLQQFGKSQDRFIPDWVFGLHISARQKIFESLLLAEARVRKSGKKIGFISTSKQLADDFERLAISLGYPTSRAIEKDNRQHVKTTNYRVSVLFTAERVSKSPDGRNYWYKENYSGMVYCATVTGGMLYTRRKGKSGVWLGNSEKIGIDARLAWGTKLGTDGRIYQRFMNRRTGQEEWLTPEDVETKVVALPD